MNKLLGIQYLRAGAALAVVGFHAANREGVSFPVGEAGVDVFFVISGFLMVAITTGHTSPWRFARDRMRRIVPVYWCATGVMLLGIVAGLFPNARLDAWHVAASFLFLPARSPATGEAWPLVVPGWTLNYEMAFYALFALTMVAADERRRVLVLSAVLGSLVALGVLLSPHGTAARFYTHSILLEFAAGAWLGLLWKHARPRLRHGTLLTALGAGGFALAWLLGMGVDAGGMVGGRAVAFGVPALLLVAGVLALEERGAVGRSAPALLLGNASYSIYVWHGMAISVASSFAALVGLSRGAAVALDIAGGVAVGLVGYAALEEPLRALLRRRRPSDAPYATAV